MDFADQAHGKRKRSKPLEAMVHRSHVVDDLIHILGLTGGKDPGLGRKQVVE